MVKVRVKRSKTTANHPSTIRQPSVNHPKPQGEKSECVEKYDPNKDGVTVTLLQTWLDCPERARLTLQGWSSTRPGWALIFGSLVHEVIGRLINQETVPNSTQILVVLGAAAKVVQDEALGVDAKSKDLQEFKFIEAQAVCVLIEYFARYEKDYTKKKWLGVESEFALPFGPAKVRGKMDGVFESNRKIWLKETKTKSVISEEQIILTTPLDLQINTYTWALERLLDKIPCGVLFDVVRRPGQKLLKNDNLDQYCLRVTKDIKKRPEHYFHRFEVAFDWEDIQNFQIEFYKTILEFDSWVKQGMPTKKYGMPCINKYGMCRYVPICYDGNFNPFYKRQKLFPELKG